MVSTTSVTAGSGKIQSKAAAPLRRRWPGVAGVALVILVIVVTLIAAVAPSSLRFSPRADEETRKGAALVIFVASYLALAIGKVPGLSIDRAGVALVGAGLMVAPVRCRSRTPTRRSTSIRSPCCSE